MINAVRRPIFFKGLLLTLILALIPVTAVSAQKITPGSACKSVNQKVTYQKKTYTCVKSGKKLAWNKGVAKPTPTPSPTVKPWVPPTAPTNWNDVVQNADGIAYWAWKKSAVKIDSSTS